MPARLRVSSEVLIESYGRLGNVHKVGAELGIHGSSVHERLQKLGVQNRGSNRYSRTKKGYRDDLGKYFFRSSWEANYARYLNLLIKMGVVVSWEFEPETFWFEKIKRGVRSYMVDFKVYYANEATPTYVEVKGWMDPKSKTKIARFRKYYPQHRLEIVGAKEYRAIKSRWASSILHWETAA